MDAEQQVRRLKSTLRLSPRILIPSLSSHETQLPCQGKSLCLSWACSYRPLDSNTRHSLGRLVSPMLAGYNKSTGKWNLKIIMRAGGRKRATRKGISSAIHLYASTELDVQFGSGGCRCCDCCCSWCCCCWLWCCCCWCCKEDSRFVPRLLIKASQKYYGSEIIRELLFWINLRFNIEKFCFLLRIFSCWLQIKNCDSLQFASLNF